MILRWSCRVLLCALPFFWLVNGNVYPRQSIPSVEFRGLQLYVNDAPYYIQGVCYSPVPIGSSPVSEEPYGDYFTDDYAYMWKRDFPLLRAMGANTIRIYGWNVAADHFGFLNMAMQYGFRVMTTFYAGVTQEWNHYTPSIRQDLIKNWTKEVNKYGDHPAILMWSFGNELNGPWNQLVTDVSAENNCMYTELECFNKNPFPEGCANATRCMYEGLYGFINDAIKAARPFTSRPVASGFADIDFMVDSNNAISKVYLMSDLIPEMDAWAMQLYRGHSFGNYFSQFTKNSVNFPKPMLITEYGVDAYNDPCGWPKNQGNNVCYNIPGDPEGGVDADENGTFIGCDKPLEPCYLPGGEVQAEWDTDLTQEVINNYPNISPNQTIVNPTCTGPWPAYPECEKKFNWLSQHWTSDPIYKNHGVDGTPCSILKFINEENGACPDPYRRSGGPAIGGFIMEWQDGSWKGFATQGMCNLPCNPREIQTCFDQGVHKWDLGQPTGCTWKAHFTCKNEDPTWHGLCGYKLWSAPDFYVNEEWFGVTEPTSCGVDDGKGGHRLDATKHVRKVFYAMRNLWKQSNEVPVLQTCEELLPCYRCLESYNLSHCHVECDYTVPAPTPYIPTSSPTSGRPTSSPTVNPTIHPSSNPTSSNPTSHLTSSPTIGPSNFIPTETFSSSDSTPSISPTTSPTSIWIKDKNLLIEFRFILETKWIDGNKTFENEIKQDLAIAAGISYERIKIESATQDPNYSEKTRVKILVNAGTQNTLSTKTVFESLRTLVQDKSDSLQNGKASKYIDMNFLPLSSDPVSPPDNIPKNKPLSSGGIVAIIVILVGVGIICAIAFQRYQKSRYQIQGKFAKLMEDDVDYVPPSIPESDGLIQAQY